MSYVSEFFDATLIQPLRASDFNLPVSESAVADLLSLLSDSESYTYLAIKSDQSYEVVKATGGNGVITLERGLEGTQASTHPVGACVAMVSPLTLAVIKDLICNYACCEAECPCEPVAVAGTHLPAASYGKEYDGAVLFSGTPPISVGVVDAPSWMTVTQEGNVVKLSGTKDDREAVTMTIAAANCGGTKIASTTFYSPAELN